jgi:predicted NBD/HSP70 family sugar kinase
MVEDSFGIPTYIENSANALIIFEQWFGVGRGFSNFLLITSEHGIGMAMVIDGKLYRGHRGVAGEIGHMIIDKNGHRCRCGSVGCLETICGNNGIIREATEAIEKELWQCKKQETPTIEEIIEGAKAGNLALRDIYRRVGQTLAVGINNIYKVFDPERIIIAGKGVLAGNLLLDPLKEKLNPEITFTKGPGAKVFIQQWHPTNYSRAAGALVLQEVYKSPANRVVPII